MKRKTSRKCNFCDIEISEWNKSGFCGKHRRKSLNKKCKKCGILLLNKNKTNYCNKHRDRTGINNPFFGKTHTKETMDGIKKKNSIAFKKLWKTKEYRDKVIKGISKPRSEEGKKNISIGVTESYNKFPELRIFRGEKMKQYWKDGTIIKNNYSCSKSKKQSLLFEDIKKILPNDIVLEDQVIKYDKNRWLFPDILIKNKNIIVEYYGDYWHANPSQYNFDDEIKHKEAKLIWEKDENRIKILNKLGYKVIVVWQSEYKEDKEKVLNKIKLLK